MKMKSKPSSLLKVNHARAAAAITAGIVCLSMNPASAATTAYRNVVLGDAPIVYYEFDETSGTEAANSGSSGTGNTGTISSAVTVTQGSATFAQGGTSYDFGGGIVSAAAAPSSLTEWTIEAWVNWDSTKASSSAVFSNDQSGWNNDVLFGISPEGVQITPASQFAIIQQASTGGPRDSVSIDLSSNSWHHVVATGSTIDGELKLYFDGALVGTDSSMNGNMTLNGAGGIGSPHITIGGRGAVTSNLFDGQIDEFALYGTVLDLTAVEAHYDTGIMAVPEPSSAALLGLGGLALILRRRR